MIYKFKSKASGDVIMLGPTGNQVLQAIGREPADKGIFEVDAMPGAIAALEQAIQREEAERAEVEAKAREEGDSGAPMSISLRQHAWPLIEMMRECHAAREPIVWGV